MKKILITGGAGFMGYHLAKHLSLEHDIHIDLIDNFSRGTQDQDLQRLLDSPKIQLHTLNLTTPEILDSFHENYTVIYHLAGMVGVEKVLANPYEVLSLNLKMTQNVLSLAKRQQALHRFVFASTSEVYAGIHTLAVPPLPTPEMMQLPLCDLSHPRTSYMLSKITGEALCLYAKLALLIVRPHNIYGPRMGMDHVIPQLFDRMMKAKKGEPLEVYSPTHIRTFCFIEDAVRMIELATWHPSQTPLVLNIGCEKPEVTIEELATLMLDIVDKPLPLKRMPVTAGSPPRRVPDMTRTHHLLNTTARVDLLTGLRKTYHWYRNRTSHDA